MRGLAANLVVVLWAGAAVAGPTDDEVGAWRTWKPIGPAIAPAELDGPDEFTEKAEIIQDRLDALATERPRVEALCEARDDALASLVRQVEDVRELMDVVGRREGHARQRLHELTERRRRLERRAAVCRDSLLGLRAERARLAALEAEYRARAARLGAEEGWHP